MLLSRTIGYLVLAIMMLTASAKGQELPELIDIIAGRDPVDIGELFRMKEFNKIWHNADDYYDGARTYLESSLFTEKHKRVLIFAMQNLSLDKYMDFCYFSIEFIRDNKISRKLLFPIIFQNARVVDLVDPKITKLLKHLRETGLGDKAYIDSVLSGNESTKKRKSGCCDGLPWPMR